MKKNYLITIAIMLVFNVSNFVNAQTVDWVEVGSGPASSSYNIKGKKITTDNNYVYSVGEFNNLTTFYGTYFAGSANNIYITKTDRNNTLIWIKSILAGNVYGQSISVDNQGSVYVSGYFKFIVDFDPSSGTFNMDGGYQGNMFILKLDSSGNFVWAKQLQGKNHVSSYMVSFGGEIKADDFGNVYLAAAFKDTVDFDPGIGTHELVSNGNFDGFLLKLNTNGDFKWAYKFGDIGNDYCTSLDVDYKGQVYISGYFSGAVSFNPNFNSAILNSVGGDDIFVAKYDSLGAYKLAKRYGGTSSDKGYNIRVDTNENMYVSGIFWSSFNFGGFSFPLTSHGLTDMYVSKINANGQVAWAKDIGGADYEYPYSMDIDNSGNVYLTGKYSQTVDFDPSTSGTANFTAVGSEDMYLLKLDNVGNYVWNQSYGGGVYKNVIGNGISVNNSSEIYETGGFKGTVDFGGNIVTSNSTGNLYYTSTNILKISQCTTNTGIDTHTACGSYTWINGINYTNSNTTATDTLINVGGCDSIVTLNLTILQPTTGTDTHTACGSYTWIDGITYAVSNNTATYTIVGGNANGCDSVITLNLTILQPTTGTDIHTACGSYTWIDGITYAVSNNTATYTIVGGNANGCDSVITLNLIVNSVDTTVTVTGNTITANLASGQYQWVDCNNSNAWIAGETNQSYTPTTSGAYAVEVTDAINGCGGTSPCQNIIITGLNNLSTKNGISFYPNPTNDILNIMISDYKNVNAIVLFNSQSKAIYKKEKIDNNHLKINLTNVSVGIYFLQVKTNNYSKIYKIVKQ